MKLIEKYREAFTVVECENGWFTADEVSDGYDIGFIGEGWRSLQGHQPLQDRYLNCGEHEDFVVNDEELEIIIGLFGGLKF